MVWGAIANVPVVSGRLGLERFEAPCPNRKQEVNHG